MSMAREDNVGTKRIAAVFRSKPSSARRARVPVDGSKEKPQAEVVETEAIETETKIPEEGIKAEPQAEVSETETIVKVEASKAEVQETEEVETEVTETETKVPVEVRAVELLEVATDHENQKEALVVTDALVKKASVLVSDIKVALGREIQNAFSVAAYLNGLEQDNLFRAYDSTVKTMEKFAKKHFRLSHGSFFNYKKLQRFCEVDERTGMLLPRPQEKFTNMCLTDLYSYKCSDEGVQGQVTPKSKTKNFKSLDEIVSWLAENKVKMVSVQVKYTAVSESEEGDASVA